MDDETLLGILLRGRPATIDEAARVAHLEKGQAEVAVQRLRERGLIAGTDDALAYPPPTEWANEAVSAHTRRVRAEAEQALASIEEIVQNLPAALRAWSVGESASDPVHTLVRHGPNAAEEMLWELVGKPTDSLVAVFTDVTRLRDPSSEHAKRFSADLAELESVRVIVPAASVADPLVRERIAQYGPRGVEYRTLERPPTWFWVDGDHLALPFVWGEAVPTSVLGARHPGLANIVRAYFDELWRRAQPVGAEQHPWTSLLRLMQQGKTLEGASHELGINARTGRRRVAAAMEHYDAPTLFALGSAWTAARATDAITYED
ncbi:hypothetical protein [Herbiconiux solani]|uniref:hypothetical protein n=1 Tax=Herbiconiux solani TaxID=661329 RepID=UPI00082708B4|nr:hypothetical protein [Herbiconiux solani]